MDSAHEKLLEAFEHFEADLEVEEILKKVKGELLLDQGVTEFGELLEEERKRFRQAAQAAQAARATYVREHWTPGCYPNSTQTGSLKAWIFAATSGATSLSGL